MGSFTSSLSLEQARFAGTVRSVFGLELDSPSDPQQAADLRKEPCVSEEPGTTVQEQNALESCVSFPAQRAASEAGNTQY